MNDGGRQVVWGGGAGKERDLTVVLCRRLTLIQFSPAGSALDFPRDDPGHADVAMTAGGTPPATGRKHSGTSVLLYFRLHQKYWCSGIPFS